MPGARFLLAAGSRRLRTRGGGLARMLRYEGLAHVLVVDPVGSVADEDHHNQQRREEFSVDGFEDQSVL